MCVYVCMYNIYIVVHINIIIKKRFSPYLMNEVKACTARDSFKTSTHSTGTQ